jgi:DNA-binding GntR family transcriptional regulator
VKEAFGGLGVEVEAEAEGVAGHPGPLLALPTPPSSPGAPGSPRSTAPPATSPCYPDYTQKETGMRSSPQAWEIQDQLNPVPTAQPTLPPRHRVKRVLHRGIVSGAIPGGTRLVQSAIARELAVSTRQVRETLFDLAAEGLVRIDARGAAVVHELCHSDLEDIYQIRILLEPVAAARGARLASLASEQTMLQAAALLAAMKSETDAGRWADLDSAFHRVIGGPDNSPRLAAMLENLRELSARYVRHSIVAEPGRIRESNAEHEEIMRAVLAGDPMAAADATLRHLDGTVRGLRVRRLLRPARSLAG